MNEIVYQQIRNEMTALYTLFGQLQMGQYVVVAALVTTILSFSQDKDKVWVSLGAGVALAGLIFAATWLGGEWFSAATRQGSYLLVAWEIPELQRNKNDSKFDRKHLWILANRAESLKTLTEQYPGKHSFGTGLKTFYWHQAFLALFGLVVIGFALWPRWQQVEFSAKLTIFLVSGFLLFAFFLYGVWASQSGDLGKSQVKKWNEYIKNRPDYDQKLLNFMDLE